MHSIEVEAKTVEEAIKIACSELDTQEENLHIEILEASPGKLLSLFSSKKAKIRARLLKDNGKKKAAPAPAAVTFDEGTDDSVSELKDILENIVKHIIDDASVDVKRDNGDTVLNITGDGSGIFIGKRGQTLEAFQYLINKIRLSRYKHAPHITVDSEAYRSRHVDSLVSLANRLSEKAKKRRGPVTTNPLNAGDRRIIHMTLKKDSELTTWSKGDGSMKKVIIAPKNN